MDSIGGRAGKAGERSLGERGRPKVLFGFMLGCGIGILLCLVAILVILFLESPDGTRPPWSDPALDALQALILFFGLSYYGLKFAFLVFGRSD